MLLRGYIHEKNGIPVTSALEHQQIYPAIDEVMLVTREDEWKSWYVQL
jgi:hypothetical protein